MLDGVRPTIINGECKLMELPWWPGPFYLVREWWLRDLIQSLTHGIITQTPTRWALLFSSMMVLVFIREGLTWRSSWSLPVIAVLFIIRGYVRTGRRLPSLCVVQFLFQVFYLLLHGLVVVLSMGYATAHLGMAFACLGGIHTSLSIPFILLILFIFRVRKITLSLGSYGFCLLGICLAWVFLVWTWSYHV